MPDSLELPHHSMVLLEQIRVLDKQRLREFVSRVDADTMDEIDEAIRVSLALSSESQTTEKQEGQRLCLCPSCASQFFHSPDHVIRRVEGRQAEGSICEYCEVQPGLDFLVLNRRKRLGDC